MSATSPAEVAAGRQGRSLDSGVTPSGGDVTAPLRAAKRPLGLHEGIDDPNAGGCQRWPEGLRLLNTSTGELRPGRCRSTNLCDYCAKLAAVENTEMLWLDALQQGSPTLWLLLTTRESDWDGERFRRSFAQTWKAVKRRWPDAEYAALVEFTTGYGPRSGGRRRPHWNVFVRGVAVADRRELWRVVSAVWCPRMDATAAQQRVHQVDEDRGGMRGLTRYVGLHFQKESQAPPKGWRGQRFRSSRGYFVRPRVQLRDEARDALRLKRLVWKLDDLELAQLELQASKSIAWELRAVRPGTIDVKLPDDDRQSRARAPACASLARVDRDT